MVGEGHHHLIAVVIMRVVVEAVEAAKVEEMVVMVARQLGTTTRMVMQELAGKMAMLPQQE